MITKKDMAVISVAEHIPFCVPVQKHGLIVYNVVK